MPRARVHLSKCGSSVRGVKSKHISSNASMQSKSGGALKLILAKQSPENEAYGTNLQKLKQSLKRMSVSSTSKPKTKRYINI